MKRFRLITAALCAVVLLATSTSTAFADAGTAHINVGPGTSVNPGANFTVTLTEDSGTTPINLVTAVLSYDQSQLQFVGFDDSTSAFDFKGASNGGSGSVTVKRGLYGGAYTGSHTVVGVTFKALGNSNVTTIPLASGTIVTNPETGQNVWDQAISAASITLNAPAQPPAGGQGGGGSTPTQRTTPRPSSSTAQTQSDQPAEPATAAVQSAEDKKPVTTKKDATHETSKKSSSKALFWTLALVLLILAAVGLVVRQWSAKAKAAAASKKKPVTKKSTAKTGKTQSKKPKK